MSFKAVQKEVCARSSRPQGNMVDGNFVHVEFLFFRVIAASAQNLVEVIPAQYPQVAKSESFAFELTSFLDEQGQRAEVATGGIQLHVQPFLVDRAAIP